ncbi:MAG: Acyl carrier protein [Verrucomicrobia subdivision 3 bacterium]|nr:Acyl carrier protein [Limisphaerales bacterium]MCS1415824.1 Acyl carrier protein [Limisphaerales bacterium]
MIEEEVKGVVLKQLKIDAAVYNEDLAVGDIPAWDSVGHVNLLMAIEERFGILFDVVDATDIETVADLVEKTKDYIGQKGR